MHAIKPNWHATPNVHAFTTTRHGGVSQAPYDSFNLGEHVGDEKNAVKNNRTLLVERFHLPQPPIFLNQTHSTKVIRLPYEEENLDADAVYTNQPNQVCIVMTADCLPVLFTTQQGDEVAADPSAAQAFLSDPTTQGKYLADLYHLACQRLEKLGIQHISGGDYCTYLEQDRFFSFRRDKQTGRMASVIWFE